MVENKASEQRTKRLNRERQSTHQKRQKTQQHINIKRHELGRMDQTCNDCGAKFWIDEKDHSSSYETPSFTVCCAGGKVNLLPLLKPPLYLMHLYTSSDTDTVLFRRNIRGYNNILSCTSFGANICNEFQRKGISNFRIHGQVYHCIGSLLPNVHQHLLNCTSMILNMSIEIGITLCKIWMVIF